jgi:hypothetical protein
MQKAGHPAFAQSPQTWLLFEPASTSIAISIRELGKLVTQFLYRNYTFLRTNIPQIGGVLTLGANQHQTSYSPFWSFHAEPLRPPLFSVPQSLKKTPEMPAQ